MFIHCLVIQQPTLRINITYALFIMQSLPIIAGAIENNQSYVNKLFFTTNLKDIHKMYRPQWCQQNYCFIFLYIFDIYI